MVVVKVGVVVVVGLEPGAVAPRLSVVDFVRPKEGL